MNIDIDIDELFNEKNQTLFFKNLITCLDNNTDTFKLSTKTIVMMEIAKLLSNLKRLYDKYSIDLDDAKLKEVLNNSKKSLLDEINVIIDNKNSSNKTYVNESNSKQINKTYLKEYHKHIDRTEVSFSETVDLVVKEGTEVSLYKDLTALHPCSNEEMQLELLHIINIDFTNNLIARITGESALRSMTLKNMSEETYQKYLELRKNAEPNSPVAKRKVKKDN